MVAALKRDVKGFLHLFGLQRRPDYRPHPQQEIDYDALYEVAERRFPNILKRLAE